MVKVAIFNVKKQGDVQRVFDEARMNQLKSLYDVYPEVLLPTAEDLESAKDFLKDVKFIFSTWGMPRLSEEDIKKYLPKLEAVFYAAGSVKGFAPTFMNCGVKVFSAAQVNAIPVAEYVFAQIILANKGVWGMLTRPIDARAAYFSNFPGNYEATVGLIGFGAIAHLLAKRLQTLNLKVLVYDPYISEEEAKEYGVTLTTLEDIFQNADIISNHLPDIPPVFYMLDSKYFNLMKPYATFINTGRGREVVEDDLVSAMIAVPTRTAVLDVTFPEPPLPDSLLRTLPNVILTPHIAGSSGDEVHRMAVEMIEESIRYQNGEPLKYYVSPEMLAKMA
ncbi:MAG: hydroxyacid dehydrogenase [Clostridia bacterium]|nr:hydroxyacid dehydrogenase [Clostridia bacterium]